MKKCHYSSIGIDIRDLTYMYIRYSEAYIFFWVKMQKSRYFIISIDIGDLTYLYMKNSVASYLLLRKNAEKS